MAKKPVVVPPSQQEDELTVTVFRFRGSSESMQKGFEAFGAALGAALGTGAPPARQVNGNSRRPQAQVTQGMETPRAEELEADADQEAEAEDTAEVPVMTSAAPKAKKSSPKNTFLSDFNLTPADAPSLVDFCAAKKPDTEYDRYLLVSLWLQKHGGADSFTGNHLFTCFRTLNWKFRIDITAPIRDLKSKKSWADSPEYGKWRLTTPGITAAEAILAA